VIDEELNDPDVYMERQAIKACPLRERCFLYGVCYADKNGRPDLCQTETKP